MSLGAVGRGVNATVDVIVRSPNNTLDGATKVSKNVRDLFRLLESLKLVTGFAKLAESLHIFANLGEFYDSFKRLYAVYKGSEDRWGTVSAIFFAAYRTGNAIKLLDKLNVINLSRVMSFIGKIPVVGRIPIVDSLGVVAAATDIITQRRKLTYRIDQEVKLAEEAAKYADTLLKAWQEVEGKAEAATKISEPTRLNFRMHAERIIGYRLDLGKSKWIDHAAVVRKVDDQWNRFFQGVLQINRIGNKVLSEDTTKQLRFQAYRFTALHQDAVANKSIRENQAIIAIISSATKLALGILGIVGVLTGITILSFGTCWFMWAVLFVSSTAATVKVVYDVAKAPKELNFGPGPERLYEGLSKELKAELDRAFTVGA